MELTPQEVRVLGCLLEKAATTPESYPLSTNALTTACNQKSSRDPLVDYSERMVTETMLLLRPAGLARTVTGSGRVEKHRHSLDEAWQLDQRQLAVLAVLMLRGPQTPGELRTRTERYVGLESTAEVESILRQLAGRLDPLVLDLGRGPGQSQNRWTHLLTGKPSVGSAASPAPGLEGGAPGLEGDAPPRPRPGLEERVRGLEARLARLESELGLESDLGS